jgi:hypothetical protein
MSKWVSIVRVFLAGGLLMEVWLHSHWSVALALTLLFIGAEIKARVAELRLKHQFAQREFEDNLLKTLQKIGKQ